MLQTHYKRALRHGNKPARRSPSTIASTQVSVNTVRDEHRSGLEHSLGNEHHDQGSNPIAGLDVARIS